MGVTCGAHRLWSHRSYEASLPLRIFLMLLNSASLQNDILEWSRDHRVHHKFSDTDADPHNSHRGFFFAHMGWLLCKKHPDVLEKGKTVSLADIEADPVVQFQRQFYKPLAILCTFYVPTYIPYYFWGENFYIAGYLAAFRYCFSLVSPLHSISIALLIASNCSTALGWLTRQRTCMAFDHTTRVSTRWKANWCK